jgi:L-2-hydroxyglutarate oxidase LhgO
MGDVQSAIRLFELLGPIMQIDRGIMDFVDSDGLTKHMIRALSVPATAVRGDEEVAAIREQRAARQAEQQELQQAQQVAEAAGNAAPALKAAQGLGIV